MSRKFSDVENSQPESSVLNKNQQIKKPYHRPKLTAFGDVRDLTLSGSPGVADSGAPSILQA